jgi:acyl carrier protein
VRPLSPQFRPYSWALSAAEIARRAGIAPEDVLRFDGNTPPDSVPTARPETIADSETLFVDLGLNSLEYLELWTSIESRLGCRFDDEDLLGDLRTVGDVVRRTIEVCQAGEAE